MPPSKVQGIVVDISAMPPSEEVQGIVEDDGRNDFVDDGDSNDDGNDHEDDDEDDDFNDDCEFDEPYEADDTERRPPIGCDNVVSQFGFWQLKLEEHEREAEAVATRPDAGRFRRTPTVIDVRNNSLDASEEAVNGGGADLVRFVPPSDAASALRAGDAMGGDVHAVAWGGATRASSRGGAANGGATRRGRRGGKLLTMTLTPQQPRGRPRREKRESRSSDPDRRTAAAAPGGDDASDFLDDGRLGQRRGGVSAAAADGDGDRDAGERSATPPPPPRAAAAPTARTVAFTERRRGGLVPFDSLEEEDASVGSFATTAKAADGDQTALFELLCAGPAGMPLCSGEREGSPPKQVVIIEYDSDDGMIDDNRIDGDDGDEPPHHEAAADALFESGEWESALDAYRALVAAHAVATTAEARRGEAAVACDAGDGLDADGHPEGTADETSSSVGESRAQTGTDTDADDHGGTPTAALLLAASKRDDALSARAWLRLGHCLSAVVGGDSEEEMLCYVEAIEGCSMPPRAARATAASASATRRSPSSSPKRRPAAAVVLQLRPPPSPPPPPPPPPARAQEAEAQIALAAVAHFNLAHALENRAHADTDAAERSYRAALALAPRFALAHNNLGVLLEHARGDADGAERCYSLALAHEVRAVETTVVAREGWEHSVDNERESRPMLAAREPGLAHAWFNLGSLLEGPARSDYAAAERAYARAAALNPSRSSAANMRLHEVCVLRKMKKLLAEC